MMPFSSQSEAKQFLVELIAKQAQLEGESLSDVERRLLLFSVDEPESAEGIPEERLLDDDTEFEERIVGLFNAAFRNADDEQQKKILESIKELKKGDHYIVVMTDIAKTAPILTSSTRVRDLLLYVAIGAGALALSVVYALYK
jgi:negative regulator of replication initiation